MGVEDTALRARIAAFDLDDIARRAAGELGWTMRFTRRVVEEYRRFLLLAVTADHRVSPSSAVDQLWHTHILHTHSYWDDLCPNVLGRPLHHVPGTRATRLQLMAAYEATLLSYTRIFGEPASDLWPSAAVRYGPELDRRVVNSGRFFIVSRRQVAVVVVVVVVVVVAIGGSFLAWS